MGYLSPSTVCTKSDRKKKKIYRKKKKKEKKTVKKIFPFSKWFIFTYVIVA